MELTDEQRVNAMRYGVCGECGEPLEARDERRIGIVCPNGHGEGLPATSRETELEAERDGARLAAQRTILAQIKERKELHGALDEAHERGDRWREKAIVLDDMLHRTERERDSTGAELLAAQRTVEELRTRLDEKDAQTAKTVAAAMVKRFTAEQLAEPMSRETALALIADAQRWQDVYLKVARERDERETILRWVEAGFPPWGCHNCRGAEYGPDGEACPECGGDSTSIDPPERAEKIRGRFNESMTRAFDIGAAGERSLYREQRRRAEQRDT